MTLVRASRTRQKRPDMPCIVRNRVTGKWLAGTQGPSWSTDRSKAILYPSRIAARTTVRAIGGAIPFAIVPAAGDAP